MKSKIKKIGLITCILTCVGCIIGSGIFGSLPTEINEIGQGVIPALVLAAIFQTAVMVPVMYSSSIIPVSGGFYAMSAKLVHPYVGVYFFIDALVEPIWIALYAILFSDYFCQLFPMLGDYKIIVELVLLLAFGIMAYFGNYIFASINTIGVYALVVVIGLFVFFGFLGTDVDNINIKFALLDGIKFNSLAIAINVFATCLSGASTLAQISNDVKNPRKNIPLAIVVSTMGVAAIYILMSIVTLKYMGDAKIITLAEIAKKFMPSTFVFAFIVFGPIIAILTSMAPSIMSSWSLLHVMAKDKLLPNIFTKTNKHGVSVYCLLYVMLFATICVFIGSSFDVLITLVSGLSSLVNVAYAFFPFAIKRKYPNAALHPGFNLNYSFVGVTSILIGIISIYFTYVTLASLGIAIWGLLLLYVIVILLYIVFRTKYLKKHNIYLMKELSTPLEVWEKHEEECKNAYK